MATSASSTGVEQLEPRKPLLRRSHRSVPVAVWYTLAAFGFALLVILVQLVFYLRRHEPRDARAIVERELKLNTLHPGERVVRTVPVVRRNGVDYFRATRGLLVLTDNRLIYLGVPPRDITGASGASDAAPTFDQREFRIDTLTRLEPSFAMLGFSRALRVESPEGTVNLAVPAGEWKKAQLMRLSWDARHKRLYAIGVWAQRVRDARAQLQRELAEYRKQPVYHIVRPGDAISSIASWYETSPEKIQELNGLTGNKIKVGQKLLIRSGS
jgi:LysM domain-containing protein